MGLSRSDQMARIRGKDTTPEMRLRRALFAQGMRYRIDFKTPHGRADVVFTRRRIAIFVDGCFWHGCPEHYVRPRSRTEFWSGKLRGNVARDQRQTRALEASGWRVLRLWEHEVFEDLAGAVDRVAALWAGDTGRPRMELRVCRVTPLDESGHSELRDLVDLRDASVHECVKRLRSTAKWKRV